MQRRPLPVTAYELKPRGFFLQSGTVEIYTGNTLDVLRTLPDNKYQCVVTSPPYFGLRDYGTATWEGGDAACGHANGRQGATRRDVSPERLAERAALYGTGTGTGSDVPPQQYRDTCGKCGARRVDQQMGLEKSPEAYIAAMVEVFREVRRVLRSDGTCWINLGDSYSDGGTGANGRQRNQPNANRDGTADTKAPRGILPAANAHLAAKQLLMMPARLALALQAPYYTGKIKSEADRIWLAAMIDAEGCMFIHKRKAGTPDYAHYIKADGSKTSYTRTQDNYGSGLEISNTHKAIVERCQQITGQGSICSQGPEENARRKQIIYRWNLRSNECREVVREIYPHLVAKQQQARIIIGCPSSGDQGDAAHKAMIDLHNGVATDVDFPKPPSMFESGWYLRSDIIWAKKNCMPESVTDRPTSAHEHVFLLTKRADYFWDQDAVKEKGVIPAGTLGAKGSIERNMQFGVNSRPPEYKEYDGFRNIRDVWTINTEVYAGAHFATMPTKLVDICIRAGSAEADYILDPFGGTGTTGMVAGLLARHATIIDLSPDYAQMAKQRITNADVPVVLK